MLHVNASIALTAAAAVMLQEFIDQLKQEVLLKHDNCSCIELQWVNEAI